MRFDIDVLYNRRVSKVPHPDGRLKHSVDFGHDLNIHDYKNHISDLIRGFHYAVTFVGEIPHKRFSLKTGDAAGLRYKSHNLNDTMRFETELLRQNLADNVLVKKYEFD